jgi:Cd2+/Zn2+-exporting ATPase
MSSQSGVIDSYKEPPLFEEFFELGEPDTVSPFITSESRSWGSHLNLKASLIAAGFLLIAFILSFFPAQQPLSNILLILVYFLAGMPSLIESIEELISFEINIDILMTLAAFSSAMIGSAMEGGLLLVLFALSGAMEEFVTTRAKSAISSLHKLSPTRACVIEKDGKILERSIKDITIGTSILVKSGEIVPLDGIVTDGASSVNLVHLTGENMPVTKLIGNEVPAGARNMEGTLTLQVTRTSSDSTLARIIQLVTQAQAERPLLQRWFDKLSKGYAISIIALAGFFAATFPFLYNIPFLGIEGSVYRALAFLIAASPCALIIAIPIAYLSAIGACARQGILMKGGITLDALAGCKVLAFDKTGTLTTGQLSLESVEALDDATLAEKELAITVAYALEKNAVHPIAKALVTYGQENHLTTIPLKGFKAVPGYGLSSTVLLPGQEKEAYIGLPDYIFPKVSEAVSKRIKEVADKYKKEGEMIAFMLFSDKIFLFRFRDTLRPDIRETIQELRKDQKLQLVMLTGDHEGSARKIAEESGIDDYYANLRPEDKLQYVTKLAEERGLAMVGDGINDAPALARATVGICMGKVGSTAAIDAADVVLLHDNIELLGWLLKKAQSTQRIVKQNLTIATLAIFVASIPALFGVVPLWMAVLLHEGGTILVGLNGLRLLKK